MSASQAGSQHLPGPGWEAPHIETKPKEPKVQGAATLCKPPVRLRIGAWVYGLNQGLLTARLVSGQVRPRGLDYVG